MVSKLRPYVRSENSPLILLIHKDKYYKWEIITDNHISKRYILFLMHFRYWLVNISSWPVCFCAICLCFVFLVLSLGGMVDSPWYCSLVTSHLQLAINQHSSKAAASRSPASDCFICFVVNGNFSWFVLSNNCFLTSLPRLPHAPHSEEQSALLAPYFFTTLHSYLG